MCYIIKLMLSAMEATLVRKRAESKEIQVRWQLVEALRYQPAGRGFDSLNWNCFIEIKRPAALWLWDRRSL
jgi:hypothetical protein